MALRGRQHKHGHRRAAVACTQARAAITRPTLPATAGSAHHRRRLDALAPQLSSAGKVLEARHKQWLKLIETADKTLRACSSSLRRCKAVRDGRRALLAADPKKNEDPTVRDAVLDAPKQAAYFIHQVHWLHSPRTGCSRTYRASARP